MINWQAPGYRVTTAGMPEGRCEVCRKSVVEGQLYIRGPRGRLVVHAACVGRENENPRGRPRKSPEAP